MVFLITIEDDFVYILVEKGSQSILIYMIDFLFIFEWRKFCWIAVERMEVEYLLIKSYFLIYH